MPQKWVAKGQDEMDYSNWSKEESNISQSMASLGKGSHKNWKEAENPDTGRAPSGAYKQGPKVRRGAEGGQAKTKGYMYFSGESAPDEHFDFADFKEKAANLDMNDVMEDILKMGGRDALIEKFQEQIKRDGKRYSEQLNLIQDMTMKSKEGKRLKKIYEEHGQFALQLEFEEEYDNIDRQTKLQLLQCEGNYEVKGMLKRGEIESADRTHKLVWVKNKTEHFISLADPKEFKLMKQIAKGDIRIPQQAIYGADGKVGSDAKKADTKTGFAWSRKSKSSEEANETRLKIEKLDAQLRLASKNGDINLIEKIVQELKVLKGMEFEDPKTVCKDSTEPADSSKQTAQKKKGSWGW